MANIDRNLVVWSGFPGGPGLSVHYAVPGAGVASMLRSFYDSLKLYIPSVVQIQVAGAGDTIDDATGTIVGSWSGTGFTPITCTGSGSWSAPAGGLIRWFTNGIVAGRRVKGRTFIVPLVTGAYAVGGTISTTTQSAFNTAATSLLTAAGTNLKIWARPAPGRAGSSHSVTSSQCAAMGVVLRSRRD